MKWFISNNKGLTVFRFDILMIFSLNWSIFHEQFGSKRNEKFTTKVFNAKTWNWLNNLRNYLSRRIFKFASKPRCFPLEIHVFFSRLILLNYARKKQFMLWKPYFLNEIHYYRLNSQTTQIIFNVNTSKRNTFRYFRHQ